MHPEVIAFIHSCIARCPEIQAATHVLDVGSLDINGSNRQHFPKASVIGIDLQPGPGVNYVSAFHEFPSVEDLHPDEDNPDEFRIDLDDPPMTVSWPWEVPVVISTEMLEHDQHWVSSIYHMWSFVQPGGHLILTCATTGRSEHGTYKTNPADSPATPHYYRNLTTVDILPLIQDELNSIFVHLDTPTKTLCIHATKRPVPGEPTAEAKPK